MNPVDEFYKALKLVDEENLRRRPLIKEYRIYYNKDGMVTMFSELDHPEGNNYIVVDNPDLFHKANTSFLRVINGKLITVSNKISERTLLKKSTSGQAVVKGIAAIALKSDKEYTEIEYYDRATN